MNLITDLSKISDQEFNWNKVTNILAHKSIKYQGLPLEDILFLSEVYDSWK